MLFKIIVIINGILFISRIVIKKRPFFLQKEITLPYDLEILSICPKKVKMLTQRDMYNLTFIALLFATAKLEAT